jgi:phosphoribosylformylglycinamidine synthase subunit PurS
MQFRVEIRVTPRVGILDPQGQAVAGALGSLGFDGIEAVHVGRLVVIEMDATDRAAAEERAVAMCRQLLANPVTEDFDVRVEEPAAR